MGAARWIVAFLGALLLLFAGGACVEYVTGIFLDPMWEAPID